MASRHMFIQTCDHLFLLTIVSPLVSMNWCGMFFLVDQYVLPSDYVMSIWFTCVIGFFVVFICHTEHEKLTKLAHTNDVIYNPMARLYSILLIIVIVFQWRGFWYILEYYLPVGVVSGLLSILAGFTSVAISGCTKSLTGVVPFILLSDEKTNYFEALSKFSRLSESNKIYRLVDHLYSVFYVHPSVILLWRGLWHLQDHTIFTSDQLMSAIVSLGCGSAAALSFYILQYPLNRYVKRLRKVPRYLVEQLWRLCVVCAAVLYWRGTWIFFELFFQKDPFTMWFVFIMSSFVLCVLNVWSIATLRGIWVDDPLDSAEDSILFDIHYFRDIAAVLRNSTTTPNANDEYVEDVKATLSQTSVSERKSCLSTLNAQTAGWQANGYWEKLHESDL